MSFFCDTAQHCVAGLDPVALFLDPHERCSGFHFEDTRQADIGGDYAEATALSMWYARNVLSEIHA